VDIISSSLNGFSLRILSGSGPPKLDVLDGRLARFQAIAGSGRFENLLEQDFPLLAVVEEIFDRLELLGRDKTWMCN
jgi:hypothetical protein